MSPFLEKPGRRKFIQSMAVLPLTGVLPMRSDTPLAPASTKNRLKVALNAFSFNAPLSAGTMTIADMIDFCAEQGFLAVDITAYYFPGYPKVPDDKVLYETKRKAFRAGLEISGTGVRNDFTEPDPAKRQESVQLVKDWIVAAEKLGAPVIRIFSGNQKPTGYTREQILAWMIDDINACMSFGQAHGVIVAIQNHADFIRNSADVVEIMKRAPSAWFGLILDIGSYRQADPYEEIRKTISYAVNWQIKEKVYVDDKEVDVDMDKLVSIIKASDYTGYLPLETLGAGDPKVKIVAMLEKMKKSLQNS
jgi:sugar phosphate isomerase/epimerase